MDPDRLLTKLTPLIPEHVRHWKRARHLADPDLRALIDKHIIATAYDILGDPDRTLLTLPPRERARGRITLGHVEYEQRHHPYGIRDHELTQGTAIFGRSGAGKTNLVFLLLSQLNHPFIFFDAKRTARHAFPHLPTYTPGRTLLPFSFNPFTPPPGLEPDVHAQHVTDIMATAYTLGDGAKLLLQQLLTSPGHTTTTLLKALEHVPNTHERVRGWKTTLERALHTLRLSNATTTQQTHLTHDLLKRGAILELESLGHSATRFLVPIVCSWIYHTLLTTQPREHLRILLVLEEAHNYLYKATGRAKESLMDALIRQGRELGLAFLIVDQCPHLISSAALGCTATTFTLNLKDPTDIHKAAHLSQLTDTERALLSRLEVGQCVVKMQHNRWRHPFLITTPPFAVDKGRITDEELLKHQERARSGPNHHATRPGERVRHVRHQDPLSRDEFALLEDVLAFPHDGVRKRYARLGWSADKGGRAKTRLVVAGWLETTTVPIGRSRKLLIAPTRMARSALGVSGGGESVAHSYWKHELAKRFKDRGYSVEVEAARRGGRVDILAKRQDERVAVEVETGMSDVASNVRNCLLTPTITEVIVACTDVDAMDAVEGVLAKSGLLVSRVTVQECKATGTRSE